MNFTADEYCNMYHNIMRQLLNTQEICQISFKENGNFISKDINVLTLRLITIVTNLRRCQIPNYKKLIQISYLAGKENS
jgi:hypothetical protein